MRTLQHLTYASALVCGLFLTQACRSGQESQVLAQAEPTTALAQPPADTVVPGRWTPERAQAYFDARPIPLGANYNPRSTINQLEFWQAETFPLALAEARQELGWARDIGMNSMRVYLHDLAWEQDSTGFLDRVDAYLGVADSLGISTTFVIFDAVWNPVSKLGTQPTPRPHIHNSGWVQSPTQARLTADGRNYPFLESYVKSLLRRFKTDERIYMWDLYNEPDNDNFGKFPGEDSEGKGDRVFPLLVATFGWAREVQPSQPVTAGVWINDVSDEAKLGRFNRFQLNNADIITFHHYGPPEQAKPYLDLKRYGRPLVCTEYVARGNGNGFLNMLPVWVDNNIGAYNWGLVDGKSQTKYPWNSWDSTFTTEPTVWHHEVFHADGKPYDTKEVAVIKMAGKKFNR